MKHLKKRSWIDVKAIMVLQFCIGLIVGDYKSDLGVAGRS